jgi:hypothetical protein
VKKESILAKIEKKKIRNLPNPVEEKDLFFMVIYFKLNFSLILQLITKIANRLKNYSDLPHCHRGFSPFL